MPTLKLCRGGGGISSKGLKLPSLNLVYLSILTPSSFIVFLKFYRSGHFLNYERANIHRLCDLFFKSGVEDMISEGKSGKYREVIP